MQKTPLCLNKADRFLLFVTKNIEILPGWKQVESDIVGAEGSKHLKMLEKEYGNSVYALAKQLL